MSKKLKVGALFVFALPCVALFGCTTKVESSEHTHNLKFNRAIEASCETNGRSAYYSCDCGKYFIDKLGLTEIKKNDWVISAKGHDTVLFEAQEATCEEDGNEAYYSCDCGKYFSDAQGNNKIAEDSWIIPALGHDYEVVEWHDNGNVYVKKEVCEHDATHIINHETVTLNSTNLNAVINDANINNRNWEDYKIILEEGNYDKLTLEYAGYVSGEGQTTGDVKLFNRNIGELSFTGINRDTTVMDGFGINEGFAVKYKNESNSGGLDYYLFKTYTIDTLKFSNMTFTSKVKIQSFLKTYSSYTSVVINNIVFENVKFDFENNTTDTNGAIHIISGNCGINNVVVKNCEFANISTSSVNGILFDARKSDDVNITVENCSFENIAFNAVQISGSGSNFGGNIVIRNNNINTTGDRALRISTIDSTANVTITGNIMVDASDADGELCKAKVIDGATVVISNNYWDSIEGTTPFKGMINSSGTGDILDENPRDNY